MDNPIVHRVGMKGQRIVQKLPEYPSRAQVTSINVLMAVVFPALLCAMEGISVVMVQMRPAVELAQASGATKPSVYLFHGGVITSQIASMVVMRGTAVPICKLKAFK